MRNTLNPYYLTYLCVISFKEWHQSVVKHEHESLQRLNLVPTTSCTPHLRFIFWSINFTRLCMWAFDETIVLTVLRILRICHIFSWFMFRASEHRINLKHRSEHIYTSYRNMQVYYMHFLFASLLSLIILLHSKSFIKGWRWSLNRIKRMFCRRNV